jgi:sulfur carrier protein ThiS
VEAGLNIQPEYSMTARLVLRGKEFEVKSGITVQNAMKKVGINSESVLATRDGELITDDEILREGDVIKLVEVISGG